MDAVGADTSQQPVGLRFSKARSMTDGSAFLHSRSSPALLCGGRRGRGRQNGQFMVFASLRVLKQTIRLDVTRNASSLRKILPNLAREM